VHRLPSDSTLADCDSAAPHLQSAAQHLHRQFRAHCQAGGAARGAFCAWLHAVLTRVPAHVLEACLAAGVADTALDVLATLSSGVQVRLTTSAPALLAKAATTICIDLEGCMHTSSSDGIAY
jgi:hypothetical protein